MAASLSNLIKEACSCWNAGGIFRFALTAVTEVEVEAFRRWRRVVRNLERLNAATLRRQEGQVKGERSREVIALPMKGGGALGDIRY